MTTQPNVCIPMKVEAFRLNAAAANGPSRLAPISQPDFTRLRLDENLRHDILGNVDLQDTANGPAFSNRVTNLATGEQRRERFGTYLHWILPRFYRSGIAATDSSAAELPNLRNKHGHPGPTDDNGNIDPSSPTYRPLPPRWIVLRHLTSKSPPDAKIPTFQAFVIESDRLSNITDFGPDVAIEIDASPFAYMKDIQSTLAEQAEMYIGYKKPLENWQEDTSDPPIARVPLSILSNVNPVFADYQPHNTNVFSMLDNFSYNEDGTKYLEKATANYYVMGWHSNPQEDPFFPPEQAPYPTHAERLAGCAMQLTEAKSDEATKWLDSDVTTNDPTRVLVHGALYEVEWDIEDKPPSVPADTIAKDYNDFSPISVGVNPVDALLAVTHARALTNDSNRVTEGSSTDSKPDPLAQDMLSLQTLVIEQSEDPDSQLKAADTLYTTYFVPAEGGQHWHVAGAATSSGPDRPTVPSPEEQNDLDKVNKKQSALDLCLREASWQKWQIWAEWWKWVRSEAEHTDQERLAVQSKVNDLIYRHEILVSTALQWSEDNKSIVNQYNWETSASPRYYTCRDPTVLLCGVKSGWPTDWTNLLNVRLDSQSITVDNLFDGQPDGWSEFQTYAASIAQKMPSYLQKTSQRLLAEFFVLQTFPTDTPNLRKPLPDNLLFPLYHDPDANASTSETGDTKVWRDKWNKTQPWFPLFVEWEIEYYHIHHDCWVPASRGPYGPPKLYLEIKHDADINNITNKRTIHGRSLVLPHTNSMLKNTVEKLLKDKARKEDLGAINAAVDRLDILTLTLESISGQLSTKQQNTHLQPTMSVPGYGYLPLPEAVEASRGVINEDAVRLMYDTTMTPYGDFPNFEDSQYSPFKPVTHGQFRFTKLNIIDKFGQAVSAIDPNRGVEPNLHPYVSEFYTCTMDDSSGSPLPRTVLNDAAQCVQLEPRINQNSRLNGYYVLWDDNQSGWRPVTEYENPIWGWLVVNYVDNGLQIFLPDGTFYREIRLGGAEGTSAGIQSWLPFRAPENDELVSKQLDALVTKLRDPKYLTEFFDVMVTALDSTMSTPNQYAGYLPAITGKPFALVNSGWSLELSHPPNVSHSTSTSSNASPEPSLESYNFQVKFGDKDRTFDGLLGYFKESSSTEFDLDNFFTYFPGTSSNDSMTVLIQGDNYPVFKPFYTGPLTGTGTDTDVKSPEEIHTDFNQHLQVFGMLVDPFTVIHAYAGLLPVTTLRLPEWALEQGLKKVTAFFHFGPVIMPNNAPPYDPTRQLASGSSLQAIPDPPEDTPAFPIPAVTIADWAWLQPYAVPPASVDNITFNPFKLATVPNEPKLERSPYTAVEGYLFLTQPITSPDVQT